MRNFPAGVLGRFTQNGTVRTYGYDNLYRLTSETVAGVLSYQKTFDYDDVGNRESQATTGSGSPGDPTAPGTKSYGYDVRDRLLTDGATYGYDLNGNLTSKSGEATYVWDAENRLIRVTKTDGSVIETVYDADGNRVQTRTTIAGQPTAITNYLVDTSGGLSHVVAEIDAAGTGVTELYVRGGDDLLSVMRATGTRFFHADGIGSIRKLTDEAGTVTDAYEYTAFGELVSHVGADPQPCAFAGEPYDANVNFQCHRARWMDPRVGRLEGMDPVSGSSLRPATLHRYLYAEGDPVAKVDPTGKYSSDVGSTLTGLLGANALRSTSAVNYSVAMRVVSAALLVAMVAAPLLTIDPLGQNQAARSIARNKLQSRVREKANGREPVLYHYTDEISAMTIARQGMIVASPRFVQDARFTMPSGAYATDIPPFSASVTQRQLSGLFYGGNESEDVSGFVAFIGTDFMPLNYAPYPNQYVRPAPPGTPVNITVLGHGPNLMEP